jgi:hypothetical protein
MEMIENRSQRLRYVERLEDPPWFRHCLGTYDGRGGGLAQHGAH